MFRWNRAIDTRAIKKIAANIDCLLVDSNRAYFDCNLHIANILDWFDKLAFEGKCRRLTPRRFNDFSVSSALKRRGTWYLTSEPIW